MLLKDQVILVTGASSGIGLAALKVFAEAGASVVGVSRHVDAAQPALTRMRDAGLRAALVSGDITRPGELEDIVAQITRDHGRLDGAFNNASITQDACPIEEIPDAVFDELFDVNVRGMWRCLKLELRVMKAQRSGAIVNTSSIAGVRGFPGLAAYTASKHAILGLTRSAALDAAAYGVRVNCLCPGTTVTPMMQRQMRTRPGGEQSTLQRIPLNRFAQPVEQAHTAAWLLSPHSSYVTGQEIIVDGGSTIR